MTLGPGSFTSSQGWEERRSDRGAGVGSRDGFGRWGDGFMGGRARGGEAKRGT